MHDGEREKGDRSIFRSPEETPSYTATNGPRQGDRQDRESHGPHGHKTRLSLPSPIRPSGLEGCSAAPKPGTRSDCPQRPLGGRWPLVGGGDGAQQALDSRKRHPMGRLDDEVSRWPAARPAWRLAVVWHASDTGKTTRSLSSLVKKGGSTTLRRPASAQAMLWCSASSLCGILACFVTGSRRIQSSASDQ